MQTNSLKPPQPKYPCTASAPHNTPCQHRVFKIAPLQICYSPQGPLLKSCPTWKNPVCNCWNQEPSFHNHYTWKTIGLLSDWKKSTEKEYKSQKLYWVVKLIRLTCEKQWARDLCMWEQRLLNSIFAIEKACKNCMVYLPTFSWCLW